MRIEKLKEEIQNIKEPRRTRYGNIRHKLEDILIIGLCTIICGGEDFADMEEFGRDRETFLRKFLELPNGIVYLYRLAGKTPLTYAKLALKENGLQDYVDAMSEFN